MVMKAEQERIKQLLRDTITLLCRNGLSFKSQFSIEALIGITLDSDDVVLVSINEQITPSMCNGSTDEELYNDGYSPGRSGGRRRRRRKRSSIKSEVQISDDESTYRGASSLLDLSTKACHDNRHPNYKEEHPPPSKKTCEGDESQDSQSAGLTDEHSEEEKPVEHAVIVKKELTDESWPPAGVMQEVTIGGSDTNSEPSYSAYNPASLVNTNSILPHLSSSFRGQDRMPSPSSPPCNTNVPRIPLLNGLAFPYMPMTQPNFVQAMSHLVGSMPSSLPQYMPRKTSNDYSATKSFSSPNTGTSPNLSQSTSRSSLPKEAVNLMSEWLRKNQHNPYPTDDVKDEFARTTNLTYNQINYWFTNARRRLLPKWELQRKIEEQQLTERLSQHGSHIEKRQFGERLTTHGSHIEKQQLAAHLTQHGSYHQSALTDSESPEDDDSARSNI